MTTETIPTLATVDDAHNLLRELAETHDWVSVFWDRGWGDNDNPTEISIIVDGDGQQPKAYLTPAAYASLVDQGVVGDNTLMTFKARRSHDFKTPALVKRTGPTANEVAEQAIRRFMAHHPDWPIVAEFYRGLSRGIGGLPQINHEYAETPARGWQGMFVMVIPGCSDVAISARKPDFLGHSIIGGGVATCLSYPHSGDDVDLDALAGDDFQRQLAEVVREKVTVIEVERTKS